MPPRVGDRDGYAFSERVDERVRYIAETMALRLWLLGAAKTTRRRSKRYADGGARIYRKRWEGSKAAMQEVSEARVSHRLSNFLHFSYDIVRKQERMKIELMPT